MKKNVEKEDICPILTWFSDMSDLHIDLTCFFLSLKYLRKSCEEKPWIQEKQESDMSEEEYVLTVWILSMKYLRKISEKKILIRVEHGSDMSDPCHEMEESHSCEFMTWNSSATIESFVRHLDST